LWKAQQEGLPLPGQPNLDRLRRFYTHLIGASPSPSKTPNIALGLSNGQEFSPALVGNKPANSTSFNLFQDNGYTNFSTGLSASSNDWNAGLIESMWETYRHNGKTYFLLDGINVQALNNPGVAGFNSSTTKELRYIVKNNLDQLTINANGTQSSFVEFWINGTKVADNHPIFNAIADYKNNPHLSGQIIMGPAKPEVQWP